MYAPRLLTSISPTPFFANRRETRREMRSYGVGGFLLLLSTWISPSHAQINSSGFVGVMAVCGGTVVILIVIWCAICCSLYRTERDYCNFKKRLRESRERYRERVIHYQLEMRRMRRRNRMRRDNIQISAPIQTVEGGGRGERNPVFSSSDLSSVQPPTPPPLLPADDAVGDTEQVQTLPIPDPASNTSKDLSPTPPPPPPPPSLLAQPPSHQDEATELDSPLPMPTQPDTEDKVHRDHPTEETPKQLTMATATAPHTGDEAKQEIKKRSKKSVHFSPDGSNQSLRRKTSLVNSNKDSDTTKSRSGEEMTYYYPSRQRVDGQSHVTHMKSLSDEEEIDVKVDKSSFLPRYSWLSPTKRSLIHQQISSSATSRGREGERSGLGGRTQEMAAFGQLQTWPQLKL